MIRMMPVGSMNMPATSSSTLTTIRNCQGAMPQLTITSAIACGMRSVVSTCAKSSALAMMNISITVTLPASTSTRGTCFMPMSR